LQRSALWRSPESATTEIQLEGDTPDTAHETLSVLFVFQAARRAADPAFTKIQLNVFFGWVDGLVAACVHGGLAEGRAGILTTNDTNLANKSRILLFPVSFPQFLQAIHKIVSAFPFLKLKIFPFIVFKIYFQ
jgi:hypothetical protein